MANDYGPKIVTDGLILCLDAADKVSYPTIGIATGWQDYGSNQSHYTVNGNDGVTLHSTSTGWVGRFPATVSEAGAYTVMFDYISDQGSGFVLDNDGIHDNSYNTSLAATTDPQSYTGTVNITSTGSIQFYIRRTSGGSITVTNFRYFKSDTWYDLSPVGNDGTLTNGPTFSSDNSGYFSFDGTDDCVILTGDDPFTDAQASFTISLWLYWSGGTSSHRRIISWGDGSPGRFFYGFNYSSGKFDMGLGNVTVTPGFAHAPDANTWQHFAITNSGTTTSFYKNGELAGTETHSNSVNISADQEVAIGQQYGSNDEFFQGRMGPFQIYNKALSTKEISQNFNSQRSRFGV